MNLRKHWSMVVLISLLAGALALGAAACDDDEDDGNGNGGEPTATEAMDEDEAGARRAMEAAVAAWNAGDVDAFLASFTDMGVMSSFDAPREQAEVFLADFIGDPPITLGDVTVDVMEGTATVEATEFAFGIVIEPTRFTLVQEGDLWLVDAEEDLPATVPEGATGVDMALADYAFEFAPEDIVDGNIAFNVSNVGQEPHELALVRIPVDFDLESVLESPEPPPEVEILAVAGPWDPGTETVAAFTEALSAGRYGLLCFIETADGVPHAALGMLDEFTIE